MPHSLRHLRLRVGLFAPIFLLFFLGLSTHRQPTAAPPDNAGGAPVVRVVQKGTSESLPAASMQASTSLTLPSAVRNNRPAPTPLVPPQSADRGTSGSFQSFGSTGTASASTQRSATGLVSNVFVDTNIREVLADIASQTGKIIVPDASVQGVVTCDLKDVPLEKALQIVLSVGNFAWKQMDGFILVGSCDPENPTFSSFSESRVVKLDHLPAKAAVAMLSTEMQKYAKASDVDPKLNNPANSVCITASPALLARLEAILMQMDQAPRQVMLDARIVVLESGNLADLGVQWNWPKVSAGLFTNSTLYDPGSAKGTNWPWGLQIGYTPSKDFTNSLLLTLNLLSQNDDATVMANPNVVAIEGKEAQISVTTEEYFQIVTQGFYTNSQLEKIEAGTTLKITPRVAKDDQISLDIKAEVSDVVSRGANNLPVVTRRIAQSTVGVENGGTAVVAGLLDNRSRYNQERVPGLSHVPALGRMFRNDARSDTARQVAVFVTARLIPLSSLDTPEPVLPKPIKPVDRALFRAELLNYLYTAGISEFEVKNVPSRAMDNASPQKEKKK